MTFVLITSSGTMAMAVNFGYRRNRRGRRRRCLITAGRGRLCGHRRSRDRLILDEGVRPWTNPMGAAQFGSCFFMITGFHGLHVGRRGLPRDRCAEGMARRL
jgi:cytochrome c oxidase subunit 3